eukprot:1160276-Pelagomonas_calceolata.AAC.15
MPCKRLEKQIKNIVLKSYSLGVRYSVFELRWVGGAALQRLLTTIVSDDDADPVWYACSWHGLAIRLLCMNSLALSAAPHMRARMFAFTSALVQHRHAHMHDLTRTYINPQPAFVHKHFVDMWTGGLMHLQPEHRCAISSCFIFLLDQLDLLSV